MKISNKIIEDYTDYLSCSHDSIMEEINSSSSRISRELAYQVCSWLEDLKHDTNCIVLPAEEDIQSKIVNTIKNGYFDSIEDIEIFIKKQNRTLDCCLIKANDESLEVDANNLLPEFEQHRQELKENEETIQNPTTEVTNQIITHINFRNINNEEYGKVENLIERKVTDIVSTKFQKENTAFNEICELHKEHLSNETFNLCNYIFEEQKNQILYDDSIEDTIKHK